MKYEEIVQMDKILLEETNVKTLVRDLGTKPDIKLVFSLEDEKYQWVVDGVYSLASKESVVKLLGNNK